jgi:hypothetical protein
MLINSFRVSWYSYVCKMLNEGYFRALRVYEGVEEFTKDCQSRIYFMKYDNNYVLVDPRRMSSRLKNYFYLLFNVR